MKAKSGSAVNSVEPTKPEEVFAADDAKPGKVAKVKAEQAQTKSGKYGSTKAPAFKASEQETGASNASSTTSSTGKNDTSASSSTQSQQNNNNEEEKEAELDWIEIELVGEDDKPISGEKYEVSLPDGSVASGTLDAQGFARIEGFEPGQCKVSFPDLDKDAWG